MHGWLWILAESEESRKLAQLGAPKSKFVASGCMASANPTRGVGLGAASPSREPRCATIVEMCGSPPP